MTETHGKSSITTLLKKMQIYNGRKSAPLKPMIAFLFSATCNEVIKALGTCTYRNVKYYVHLRIYFIISVLFQNNTDPAIDLQVLPGDYHMRV